MFLVYFAPYRLDADHVGESVYKPVYVRRHKSPREARKSLIRLITGTDNRAQEYMRAVHNNPYPIALRYYAESSVAPFHRYAPNDLKGC